MAGVTLHIEDMPRDALGKLAGEQFLVDCEVDFDLEEINEEILQQFIADGGEPWDIYRIETALFGAPLGQRP